jgi:hypothetical protein
MFNKGWLKRALPFLATFALGIFIASFFVSVVPRSRFRDRRMHHFEEMQQLRKEMNDLRQENLRLKNMLSKNWDGSMDLEDDIFLDPDGVVPPPPPLPPAHRSFR